MNAILSALLSDLRRRRLQTAVVLVVVFLAAGATTLALSLAVETDAPYDHAFAQAHGAHLTITYDTTRVSVDRLARTSHTPRVTAAAGPWPQVLAPYGPGNDPNAPIEGLSIIGRSQPGGAVDRLTIESGRWPVRSGEVVVARSLADKWRIGLGDELVPPPGGHGPTLTVVGVAASISPYADAWVTPAQARSLVGGAPSHEQMAYRVQPAGTDAQLRAATQTITAGLPRGAVTSVGSYLDVKRNADITTAVMIPFLLAFSAFALVASILIIANVVSGIVIAGYRDIGILKAVGFTPSGVVLVLLGQILIPAVMGSVLGIVVGTLASQPFLQDTAHALDLPAPFTAVIPIDVGVLGLVLAVAVLAAYLPARRAGRLSAVAAIARGSAPVTRHASRLERALANLPLPPSLSVGLGDSFARPWRSLATTGAVVAGVATVVFALSLRLSLLQVASHLIRDRYVQVVLYAMPPNGPLPLKPGAPRGGPMPHPASSGQIETRLRHNPATVRFVAEGQAEVNVPGIAEPIPYIAYRGPSAWTGFALISGRWFAHPGEVVAPTKLLRQTGLQVGDHVTAAWDGHPMRLTIVGEILDQDYDDLLLRGTWASLAAVDHGLWAQQYDVRIRPGTNAETFVNSIFQEGNLAGGADIIENSSTDTTFLLIIGVVSGLALVLTLLAVAGVFNTVVLNTRERARDIAILKAIGMTPRGVVGMVLASVALLGLVAGIAGIPVGMALHAQILQIMGQIASSTAIPPSFLYPLGAAFLPALALAGVAIATLGAWLPAQWAAHGKVVAILQAE